MTAQLTENRAHNGCDRLAIALLVVCAATACAVFRDYGLGWDDYAHMEYGDLLVAFYTSGFADKRALSFVNLYMYGGGFDLSAALASKILPFTVFETRRLVGAAVGIVGLIAVWRTSRRLGGQRAGLTAMALLATCPLYVGHLFMNAKDGPFAVAMAVLMCGLVRMVDQYPRPCWTTRILVGTRTWAVDRFTRHGRFRDRRRLCDARICADPRCEDRRNTAGERQARTMLGPDAARGHPRLRGDGAGLALGRYRPAQSIPRLRTSRTSSRSHGTNCSAAGSSPSPTCHAAMCRR